MIRKSLFNVTFTLGRVPLCRNFFLSFHDCRVWLFPQDCDVNLSFSRQNRFMHSNWATINKTSRESELRLSVVTFYLPSGDCRSSSSHCTWQSDVITSKSRERKLIVLCYMWTTPFKYISHNTLNFTTICRHVKLGNRSINGTFQRNYVNISFGLDASLQEVSESYVHLVIGWWGWCIAFNLHFCLVYTSRRPC